MSEMIERMAKAIYMRQFGTGQAGEISEPEAEIYARAAIEAMREPTEGMVSAGYDADNGEGRNLGAAGAREAWQLMIDEALR